MSKKGKNTGDVYSSEFLENSASYKNSIAILIETYYTTFNDCIFAHNYFT